MLLFVNSDTRFILLGGTVEQLLSVAEAAKRLGGISKWTLHAWLSQGRIQRTKGRLTDHDPRV